MTDPLNGLRPSSDPSRRPAPASRLVRALYTHNPFYVISADLVFIGLRMSFDPGAKSFDTWALISSLAGYTLLLAVTACLLVRYGKVWDDMRSVLLLIVMMFLAISSTSDDVLVLRPNVGLALALGGLAFAVVVSEGLLRGMRLWLPSLYRGPYYLILTLFFVYPVALRQLLARPDSPTSHWALFGFSTAAGLAFLTLLPAIRRGSAYVKGNGSPWLWPFYPWSLFFFLGLGVCGRAYYLCISLHNVEGYQSIFGAYFLVPFGFAVAALILEHGLVAGRQGVLKVALAIPLGLVVLAMVGHRTDEVYEHFLTLFQNGLGVAPPAATLLLATAFYSYAAWRSVPMASGLAMVSLVGLSVVGPSTLGLESLSSPNGWPLLPVALFQGWLAIRRRESVRGVIAAACLVASISSLSFDFWPEGPVVSIAVHLTIVALLALGAIVDDELGECLRGWGACLLAGATVALMAGEAHLRQGLSPAWIQAYPVLVAVLAVVYARLVGGWPFYAVSGSIAGLLLAIFGGRIYVVLRQQVAGLDRIAWGLASFMVAALISLWKAGAFRKWLDRRGRQPLTDQGRGGYDDLPTR
jgi:hypothetical protein